LSKFVAGLSGAFLVTIGAIAIAQPTRAYDVQPFADVPADHWAYRAVNTLENAGILIGYPDNTFGGKRAMTRYEFAVAVARFMPYPDCYCGIVTKAMPDDVAGLRHDLWAKLASNKDALDALRKLLVEFTPELQNIGQNVAAAKEELDALEIKMAALEEEQRRVKFNGALSLIAEADSVTQGSTFVDGNGNTVGVDKRLLRTVDVHHDFVLDIRGRVADDTTAHVKLDFGNYLSALGNTVAPGYPSTSLTPGSLAAAGQQTTVWEANIVGGGRAGRLRGGGITLGRFGNHWTAYTLEQVDADVYTQLDQTDNGDIPTDGVKFNLPIKRLDVEGWAGQMKSIPFAEPWGGPAAATSTQLGARPGGLIASTHAVALVQGDGVRVTYGHPDSGQLGATVENFATAHSVVDPNAGTPYRLLAVYGIDYTGDLPLVKSGVRLMASLTDAATSSNSRGFNDTGNNWRYCALDTQVGRQFGSAWLQGGYQYIGPEFSAPGNWGREASWINPANVEGGIGSAKVNLTRDCVLSAKLADYHAAYGSLQNGDPINSPLGDGDTLTNYKVGIDYTGRAGYDTTLSYEQSTYDLKNHARTLTIAGTPVDSLLTIGIGHTITKNTTFSVLYQFDKYSDKGTGFGAVDSAGSVVSTQMSVRF